MYLFFLYIAVKIFFLVRLRSWVRFPLEAPCKNSYFNTFSCFLFFISPMTRPWKLASFKQQMKKAHTQRNICLNQDTNVSYKKSFTYKYYRQKDKKYSKNNVWLNIKSGVSHKKFMQ